SSGRPRLYGPQWSRRNVSHKMTMTFIYAASFGSSGPWRHFDRLGSSGHVHLAAGLDRLAHRVGHEQLVQRLTAGRHRLFAREHALSEVLHLALIVVEVRERVGHDLVRALLGDCASSG